MATYTVATGDKSIGPITMTGGQVDSIVFTDNAGLVDCINAGTTDVYLTADGRVPAVPSAGASSPCYRIPASEILPVMLDKAGDVIKIISSGTPQFSVQLSAAS